MQSRCRPFRVTLLSVGVLTLTSLFLLRLVESVRQWQFLNSLPGVSPIYLALTGLFWVLIGLPLFWGLWHGSARAARCAPGFTLAFALYYWFDKIFLANRATSLTNWPVIAMLTVIGLAYMFWALNAPMSRNYFAR